MAQGGAPRVLLTGAHGFVGSRLTARLACDHPDWRLDTPRRSALDTTDAGAVEAWVRAAPPDIVVHLAAISTVTATERDPRLAWKVNFEATLNLVLALQAHCPHAALLLVSSAEVYGASLGGEVATDERALLQPVNPYAASKAASDILVRQSASAGLTAAVARPFNHIGPGQGAAFVAPGFAAQIARIEAGLQPPVISVGALDDERDFLDVEDVVSAYAAILDAQPGLPPGEVFNVASGVATRIGDILERLLSQARTPIEVRLDPSRLRKVSTPRVVGDASRLRRTLGWAPRIALHDTLARILDEQRSRVGAILRPQQPDPTLSA